MSDLAAQIRYEIRCVEGPVNIEIRSIDFSLPSGEGAYVIVRVTTSCGSDVDVKIVGVIGDRYRSGVEALNLIRYMSYGGTIFLNDELNIAPSPLPPSPWMTGR